MRTPSEQTREIKLTSVSVDTSLVSTSTIDLSGYHLESRKRSEVNLIIELTIDQLIEFRERINSALDAELRTSLIMVGERVNYYDAKNSPRKKTRK